MSLSQRLILRKPYCTSANQNRKSTDSDLFEHPRALEVFRILGCLQLSCTLMRSLLYLQFIKMSFPDFKKTKIRKKQQITSMQLLAA